MRRESIGIAGVAIALVIVLFVFAPVVYVYTTPSGQFASLGPVPGYESLSCKVFGIGTGYWQTNVSSIEGAGYLEWSYVWSYHWSCPPLS
jgi:hypothetical protein